MKSQFAQFAYKYRKNNFFDKNIGSRKTGSKTRVLDRIFCEKYKKNSGFFLFQKNLYKLQILIYSFFEEVNLLKVAKREQRIISLLETNGELSVNELSRLLDVSVSTLRKQLAVMQENGLVIRTYGGVMSVNRVPDESFDSKQHKNISEKRRIANKARSLITSGSSIALGSGTTVFVLSNLLSDLMRGTIYTNSLQVADYLSRCETLEVHISGGIIRGRTGSIIGNEVAEYFRGLKQLDYAFIGCDAIDSNGEVFSDNLSVAAVEKMILLSARHKYILCDSSKIGKIAVARVAGLKDCDGLITCHSGNDAAERYKDLTEIIYA